VLPTNPEDARALNRSATVHGALGPIESEVEDTFEAVLRSMRGPAEHGPWRRLESVSESVLRGLYRALGLWYSGSHFPAWQTLCYDSRDLNAAASVAVESMEVSALRLGLPLPSPKAMEALGTAWRPPYVWLRAGERGSILRLTPRLLRNLSRGAPDPLDGAEALTLRRWLTRAREAVRSGGSAILVRRPGHEPVRLARGLEGRVVPTIEGSHGAI
jgi:hypothetical protein